MKIGVNIFAIKEMTGIGTYLKNILQEIGKIDSENTFIIFVNKKVKNDFSFDFRNFKYVILPDFTSQYVLRVLFEQFILPFYFLTNGIDVLFNPSVFNPLLSFCPKVTIMYDLEYFKYKGFNPKNIYLRFATLAATKSKSIITMSEFSKKEILENLSKQKLSGKIFPAYAGTPDLPQTSQEDDINTLKKFNIKKPYLFYVGLIVPHKNIENILKSFKIFVTKHPECTLVLSGRVVNELINVDSILDSLDLKSKVILTGRISDAEKSTLYKNSEMLVFLSFHEGFGLPILEAQKMQTPILASNVTSIPEIAGNGAVLVNPRDIKEIVNEIERIFTDKNLKKQLIENGTENVKRFSWKKTAGIILEKIILAK